MDHELSRSILKTFAYFDTFDFPLTAEEAYRSLWEYPGQIDHTTFRWALDELVSAQKLSTHTSFYFLPGRESLVPIRQGTISLIKEKMMIARQAGTIVSFFPFVRALFVCNTVASATPSEESDIDVFVIASDGRLWLVRALTTLALSVTRLRRTKTKIHNRICLSFFVTDRHLDLADITFGTPDIYLAYWIDQLIPVYDPEYFLKKIHKKNQWVNHWLPRALRAYDGHPRWLAKDTRGSRLFRFVLASLLSGKIGDMVEKVVRSWQLKKMSRNTESLQSLPDSRVVVNDSMLKFHENDRREFFRTRWQGKCTELGV